MCPKQQQSKAQRLKRLIFNKELEGTEAWALEIRGMSGLWKVEGAVHCEQMSCDAEESPI